MFSTTRGSRAQARTSSHRLASVLASAVPNAPSPMTEARMAGPPTGKSPALYAIVARRESRPLDADHGPSTSGRRGHHVLHQVRLVVVVVVGEEIDAGGRGPVHVDGNDPGVGDDPTRGVLRRPEPHPVTAGSAVLHAPGLLLGHGRVAELQLDVEPELLRAWIERPRGRLVV